MSAIEATTTLRLQMNNGDSANVNHFVLMMLWRQSEEKRLENRSKGTVIGCQTTSCQHTKQKEDAHHRKGGGIALHEE